MYTSPVRFVYKAAAAVALLCLLVWTGAVGYLWLNEPRLVFRSEFSRRPGRVLDPGFTSLRLRTTDGIPLDAVMLAADDPTPRDWVIYFQGNAGSLRRPRVQDQLRTFQSLGYDVLSFDYRGYGRSGGISTETGLYEDAFAAYGYLTRAGVSPTRIILAGQSLGSAVAVELATRVASAGVALFSPIDSVPMTAGRIYPWVPVQYLAANRFDSSAKVGRIGVPVVVFHSATDRLIPLQAARDLFAKIRAPKRMVETGGGHNGAGFADRDVLRETMWTFWPPAVASDEDGRSAGATAPADGRRAVR
ncbi:MAG TPA: alpha/beta hydrolase [Vicinamibacterales bacterium]